MEDLQKTRAIGKYLLCKLNNWHVDYPPNFTIFQARIHLMSIVAEGIGIVGAWITVLRPKLVDLPEPESDYLSYNSEVDEEDLLEGCSVSDELMFAV